MELKPGFDDEFSPKLQRQRRPRRLIAGLMFGVMVCAVALSVAAGTLHRKANARRPLGRVREVSVVHVEAPAAKPREPFVLMAPLEIDAAMVVPAPAGIDAAMVFDPDGRQELKKPDATASAVPYIPVPGPKPSRSRNLKYPPVAPPLLPTPGQPR